MPNQPFVNDFVRETSNTTGTGDITLLGAVASFRTFASMFVTNDKFYYTAKHRTLLEAESGIGTFTASGTIARTSILESTNANAAVAFSAGTKDVFIAPISKMFPTLANNEIWQGVSGSVPVTTSSPTFAATVTIVSQLASLQPLVLRGAAGQTANLIEYQDNTNAVLLSVQPGGEIRGHSTFGNIKLQDGITGATIFDANIISTAMWADSVTGTTRLRLGNTTPANADKVQFCTSGGNRLNRFAISSGCTQISPRLGNTIPAPIAGTALEVCSSTGTDILLALRGGLGQSGNLLIAYDATPTALSAIGPTGRFLAPDGAVGTPGLTFLNDTNTGFYRIGNDDMAWVTNGTARIEVTATGSVVLAKNGAITTTATDGFTYLPSCAGKPTGVPTTQTGTIPIVVDSTNSANFVYSGGEWVCVGPTTQTITFGLALGTPITTGTNKTNEITMPFAGKILRARARAKTGPTGASLIFDINLNGTTIWSTQANRLTIAAASTTGSQTTFNTTTFADGDVVTIDVDQVGSTVAGSDLTIQLEVRKTG